VASGEAIADREELQVHSRGGCFNKVIRWIVVAALTIGATAVVLGIHASGTSQNSSSSKSIDDPGAAARTKGKIEDLAAHGIHLRPSPTVNLHEPPKVVPQQAVHGGGALEIVRAKTQQGDAVAKSDPAFTVHPPASRYAVMAGGSAISAVLISGISSDLPGPILARVRQNVVGSAIGKYVLILQGSSLIGAYQNAPAYRQQRVQIAWATADLSEHLEHESVADAGHRSERLRGLLGSDQQPLPRTLRNRGADEPHKRKSDGRTDGGIRWQ